MRPTGHVCFAALAYCRLGGPLGLLSTLAALSSTGASRLTRAFLRFKSSPYPAMKKEPDGLCFHGAADRTRLLRCTCMLSPRRPSRPPQHARCSKLHRSFSPRSRLLKVQVLPFSQPLKKEGITLLFSGAIVNNGFSEVAAR